MSTETEVEVSPGALRVPEFDDAETQALLAEVRALPVIEDDDQAELVASYAKGFYSIQDRIHQVYDGIARMADQLHKQITGDRKRELDKAAAGLDVTKKLLIGWDREKERRRKVEEERLRRQAEEEAEREQLERAQEAMEDGDDDQAEAILEEPPEPPPAIVLPKERPASGLNTRETYIAELVDLMEVAKAVVAGKIPTQYIQANMPFANQQARALKADFRVPGFRVMKKTGIVRGR